MRLLVTFANQMMGYLFGCDSFLPNVEQESIFPTEIMIDYTHTHTPLPQSPVDIHLSLRSLLYPRSHLQHPILGTSQGTLLMKMCRLPTDSPTPSLLKIQLPRFICSLYQTTNLSLLSSFFSSPVNHTGLPLLNSPIQLIALYNLPKPSRHFLESQRLLWPGGQVYWLQTFTSSSISKFQYLSLIPSSMINHFLQLNHTLSCSPVHYTYQPQDFFQLLDLFQPPVLTEISLKASNHFIQQRR